MIKLFKVRINEECFSRVENVLKSGYIGEGPQVKRFEKELSKFLDGYVVLMNSCTSALHLAYHMIGIRGYEVISTSMTCMATNTPIINNGGTVVWADVDPSTGNIDPESVKSKIGKLTKAVSCVHYGGNLCDKEILNICKKNHLTLVEDCAHMTTKGLGGIQCYSFQAIKFITCGDGGALVTKDKKLYERAKLLRWYGIDRDNGASMRCLTPIKEVGYKFHMNDISASIGLGNLRDIRAILDKVKENAKKYDKAFENLRVIHTVPTYHRNDHWLYILLVDASKKYGFMDYLRENEIETSLVHARNDTQPVFQSKQPLDNDLYGLESFWERQVCIPVGWWLKNEDVEHIIHTVIEYDQICVN